MFNHINTVINPGDVILDFTVLKYDWVTKLPDQSQDLIVWSNDFKIFDSSTGEYEDFGRDNPYNPFITGINTGNTYSPGQINVKLKPENLPKVEDTNRDGFPTGGAVLHIGEYNSQTGKVIEGTEYQIQINFTYSKETGTYKYSGYSNLSNWNLLKDFHHSTSKNTGEGYVESATLELWSNYGETANFGIDLSKFNYLGQDLPGAVYTVKVALPTGKYISLTQDVFNGEGNIEIPNLYVKEGTIITISEKVAPIGYEVGLISKERFERFQNKKKNIEKEIERLKNTIVKPEKDVNDLLEKYGTTPLSTGTKMAELLKRTELDYEKLEPIDKERPVLSKQEKEEVEIQIKYEGYIKMQEAQVEKFKKLESKILNEDIDYEKISGISLEARQKLNKFKPRSIGQASRISGVSPADISVLLVYLQQANGKNN